MLTLPDLSPALHSNRRYRGETGTHGVLESVDLSTVVVSTRTESNILLIVADSNLRRKIVLRRPDLVTHSLFFGIVLCDDFAHSLLEVKGTLLHLGMKFTVDEDTSVEVLLRVHAQVLVLRHDSLVHVADEVEGLIGGILVAVDFVAHHTLRRAGRSESLHEEEVGTKDSMLASDQNLPRRIVYTHEILKEALGQK